MGRPPKRKVPADGDATGWQGHTSEPLARMLALHPKQTVVALSVGSDLRVVNFSTGEQHTLGTKGLPHPHSGAIRLLDFSSDGSLMLSGGDDKTARLWDTASWEVKATWRIAKRGTAGTFFVDGKHVMFADKYGEVLVGNCAAASAAAAEGRVAVLPAGPTQLPKKGPAAAAAQAAAAADAAAAAALSPMLQPQEPDLMFAHYNAIITSLTTSPDGRFVVSTDRDHKVRVSTLPSNPAKGCWLIQAFCMGHASFVMTSAFVPPPAAAFSAPEQQSGAQAGISSGTAGEALLVSGAGDGTVRLWDYLNGKLLDTYVAAPPTSTSSGAAAEADVGCRDGDDPVAEAVDDEAAGEGEAGKMQEGDGDEVEDVGEEGDECAEPSISGQPLAPTVLSVAASPDGRFVSAVVEGDHDVHVLRVDATRGALVRAQRFALPGVRFPCHVAFDSAGRLWVLGGPRVASSRTAHLGVAHCVSGSTDFVDCTASVLVGSAQSLLEQRGAADDTCEAGATAGDAADDAALSYSQHLARFPYDTERNLKRKANRNDLLESARLASLRATAAAAATDSPGDT